MGICALKRADMVRLSAREAYRRWAPTYAIETAISLLDEELAAALSPPLDDTRLLDAGCGIGRRLPRDRAALAVGVDASAEMLATGGIAGIAAADIRALPFIDASFDVVWCRLVLGHIADPEPAYLELARVCRLDGHLLVTDFHAEAVAAGHQRTFRDQAGSMYEIENYAHDVARHLAAAGAAGLALVETRDAVVGPQIKAFYSRAGRLNMYERDMGLKLVAAYLFRRSD
jgi:malonyl-CoA O-methyltransferase